MCVQKARGMSETFTWGPRITQSGLGPDSCTEFRDQDSGRGVRVLVLRVSGNHGLVEHKVVVDEKSVLIQTGFATEIKLFGWIFGW